MGACAGNTSRAILNKVKTTTSVKTNGLVSGKTCRLAVLLFGLVLGACVDPVHSQPAYKIGAVVTNFTLITRRPWTNDAGRVFMEGAPIRLSDFAERVVFFEFFDAT